MPSKIVTRPGVPQVKEQDFSMENFIRSCCAGNYILVIGNEAVLSKKENVSADGDSNKLLFECTMDYLRRETPFKAIDAENFNQLSAIGGLRNYVIETIKELDFEQDFEKEIDPDLYRLLNTKCFRVVLTTTIDPYLEIAMEKVWGKKGVAYQVRSIYDIPNDFLSNEISNDEFNQIMPTLYYVFGKADKDNETNRFVLSENDAMQVIAKWFSKDRPEKLLNYIHGNNKMVLALGCKFDDWLFRFFWFILKGKIDNLSHGQVALEFKEEDETLRNYLIDQHIRLYPDARKFMRDAADLLENAMITQKLPRNHEGIFISYAHEDKHIALPLFYGLVKADFPVWLDENLNEGDDYRQRINKAINKCSIFMPILSSQVKYDLLHDNKDKRYYITDEWATAQQKIIDQKRIGVEKPMTVLPIVIGDYDVTKDYHKKAEPCIIDASALFLSYETFETLKSKISNIFNIKYTTF